MNATPIVPRPAWVPMTGPISPTMISSPYSGRSIATNSSTSVQSACSTARLDIRPSYSRTLSTRKARALDRVRCLPPCSTLPSMTSMIGLIASAVASSALALPIRPPFFRFSSVSSAPNTRVRDARSVASAAISSTSPPPAARRAAGDGDHAETEGHAAAVDDAHGDLVGDRSGRDLGALHRRRQRTRQRHDDHAGRTVGGCSPVGGLERARRRCCRRGQGRRVARPSPRTRRW